MKDLTNDILEVIHKLEINYMPTRKDLEDNGHSALSSKIQRNGGFSFWKKKLNLKDKTKRTKWNDKSVELEILKVSEELFNSTYMPTASQFKEYFGDFKLHNAISKGLGYRGWAEKLGLDIQNSETKLGQNYELIAKNKLESLNYNVLDMSTGHPFDLLINDTVKVDVKCACAYYNKNGSRLHTFGINKKIPTCDIYIIFSLDEKGEEIEKIFIIPSHHIKVTSLNIGAKSKYDIYLDKFEYIDKYYAFKKSI